MTMAHINERLTALESDNTHNKEQSELEKELIYYRQVRGNKPFIRISLNDMPPEQRRDFFSSKPGQKPPQATPDTPLTIVPVNEMTAEERRKFLLQGWAQDVEYNEQNLVDEEGVLS